MVWYVGSAVTLLFPITPIRMNVKVLGPDQRLGAQIPWQALLVFQKSQAKSYIATKKLGTWMASQVRLYLKMDIFFANLFNKGVKRGCSKKDSRYKNQVGGCEEQLSGPNDFPVTLCLCNENQCNHGRGRWQGLSLWLLTFLGCFHSL